MKVLSLILCSITFASTAANLDAARGLLQAEDLQDIRDASMSKYFPTTFGRKMQEEEFPSLKTHEAELCFIEEAALYNMTAIEPAFIPNFLFSFLWADPSFDLGAFFDALSFSKQCNALGGEEVEVDIKIDCGFGPPVMLEGYKLCKPPICDDFEYLLFQSAFLSFYGSFLGCKVTLVSDEIPSIDCLDGLNQIYNGTELQDFSPEAFVTGGGTGFVETLGICNQNFFSMKADVKVCHMTELEAEYQNITDACTYLGGDIFPMDIIMDTSYYHRTYMKYPLCAPKVCEDKGLLLYYEYIASLITGEHYGTSFGIDLHFLKSVMNSCDEIPNNLAFMKKYNNTVLARNCKWLKKRPRDLRLKFCIKTMGFDGYDPASVVCPSTCCTCEEKDGNVFLKKASVEVDGTVTTEVKTCAWLKNSPQGVIDFLCDKEEASFIEGYPPASAACPETCGNCDF